MLEKTLIKYLTRFNHLLHLALAVALVAASILVIWQFTVEVTSAVINHHLVTGFLQSLGTLFLVWTLSSLISAEISYLTRGVLHVRVFVEVTLITLLRLIITRPMIEASADGKVQTSFFDPVQYGLILAALLVVGLLHWLVGTASIAGQEKSPVREEAPTRSDG